MIIQPPKVGDGWMELGEAAPPTNLDAVYEAWVVPWSCPCCNKCWLVIKGKGIGKCVYGGPYKGYIEVPE
jgi:hypothetical protein